MFEAKDLAAYLGRIGHSAPVAPDMETLRAIVRLHAAAIAFENLDPLLMKPVSLAPHALMAKLVHGGRGGFCFEHNVLLLGMLQAIGFDASGLVARVIYNLPEDALTPRSHMLIRLALPEGTHVVDVGFGGQTLSGVLKLEADIAQETPHEPYRLIIVDGDWRLQTLIGGAWRSMYRFDMQHQHPLDYNAVTWFLSTSPESKFTQILNVARTVPGRRLALNNRDFAIHDLVNGTTRRTITDNAELCDLLEKEFDIALPDRAALIARFERLE